MKQIITIILLITIISNNNLQAQDPQIEWQHTIGANNNDYFWGFEMTPDGGYIIGGTSFSDISGDKTEDVMGSMDYWVVKLDENGEVEWENTIGGNDLDQLTSIALTTDGGYILGGSSTSNISGDKTEDSQGNLDFWVVKINSLGIVEWDNTIGGSNHDRLYSIVQTTDGGFIVGGYSDSNISGDKNENTVGTEGFEDYWVVKLNSNGNIQWQNTIGGNDEDELEMVIQTADGGYIVLGDSSSGISGDKTEPYIGGIYDYWIVKLSVNGVIEWQNTIGGSSVDKTFHIEQTSDLGYIIGGVSSSGISGDKTEENIGLNDYWVIKLNSVGEIEWQNTIGGDQNENLFYIEQIDNGYIISGYSDSDISGDKTENSKGGSDFWIVRLNSLGTIVWQNTIGGANDDFCKVIHKTDDGGYILGGDSNSDISEDKLENSWGLNDFWIMKIEDILSVDSNDLLSKSTLFPIPTNNYLNLLWNNQTIDALFIFDIYGRLYKTTYDFSNGKYIIDTTNLTEGIYFLKIIINEDVYLKKFIKKE